MVSSHTDHRGKARRQDEAEKTKGLRYLRHSTQLSMDALEQDGTLKLVSSHELPLNRLCNRLSDISGKTDEAAPYCFKIMLYTMSIIIANQQ